jgi:hypothetical protein
MATALTESSFSEVVKLWSNLTPSSSITLAGLTLMPLTKTLKEATRDIPVLDIATNHELCLGCIEDKAVPSGKARKGIRPCFQ